MMTRNQGHIVTIASVAGVVGTSQLTDYCASKFGTMGFTESLDIELVNAGKTGVKVTTVCPYFIRTGLFEGCQGRRVLKLVNHIFTDRVKLTYLLDYVVAVSDTYRNDISDGYSILG